MATACTFKPAEDPGLLTVEADIADPATVGQITRRGAGPVRIGTRVNAVSPGIIQIPMHPPETDAALGDRLRPLGRVGHIGDLVDGVLLLESPHIIGEILPIDGGQTAAHQAPG